MAIVQISQITNRLGLNTDLPQLAGGELGWSTDTRQLYIGNGTLQQGAPVIGNTEILTEFSDILNLAAFYTYKGTAAGYTVQTGPTAGTPVIQSMQSWLDQRASVKDFGAVGDGLADDTAAINRALYQLYCIQSNPQVRRSLFFPAGVYKVSGTINIPSYATLYGEGPLNSIIRVELGSNLQHVAQTADSLQQTGNNIGNNGATPPTSITIDGMAFQTQDTVADSSVFLVQSADGCHFTGVSFLAAQTTSTITPTSTVNYGVTFGSTPSLLTNDITFDNCLFSGAYYGAATDQYNKSVTINNSEFTSLYVGVALGFGSSPDVTTGFRLTNNIFDNIYAEGIIFGPQASLNASGYNVFYDVADNFGGITNPARSIIKIQGNNNVSIGDMFARSDADSVSHPRVYLGASASTALTNGSQLQLGTKVTNVGTTATLENNITVGFGEVVSVDSNIAPSFKIDYSIVRELNAGTGTGFRSGTLWVTGAAGVGRLTYMDDYTQNSDIGITLSATEDLNGTITVQYKSTNIGTTGQMSYSISYFNYPNT